jgi:hypothetical protein
MICDDDLQHGAPSMTGDLSIQSAAGFGCL